jgi:GNAT superfamily N-acetyltransferase
LAIGCLDQLFVAPEVQGRGIGRTLLYLAKQKLPEGLWLWTVVDNQRACLFISATDAGAPKSR